MPVRRTVLQGSLAAAVLAAIPSGAAANAAPVGRSVDLTRDRTARAEVVIADDASDQVLAAAETLVEYVAKATGVTLSLLRLAEHVPNRLMPIFVGFAGPTSPVGVADRAAALPIDGYLVAADPRAVTILGQSDHGTRFGVLDVLERHLGVRWLFPGESGEDVPLSDSLAVPLGERTDHPRLVSRLMSPLFTQLDPQSPDWRSADPQVLWASRARLREYVLHNHNLWRMFPVEEFGETHPEYYPIIDGQPRLPAPGVQINWQPHFSEPGTIDVAVAHIVNHFDQYPDAPSFSLGVNDGAGYSQDDLETSADGRASASAAYYGWMNEVVTRVVAERPVLATKLFGCLAYRNVVDPPPFPLHPQVVPYLTNDRYGWVDPEFRARDQALTEAWAAKADRVAFYDYLYGATYLVPRMYTATMGEVYHHAGEHHVYSQTSELFPNWGEGPKAWIYGKLLWNPSADVAALAVEWCRRTAGDAAAPHLAAYFDLWEEIWRDRVPHTVWFTAARDAQNPYFYFQYGDYLEVVTAADVAAARGHLEAARDATTTAAQRARVTMLLRSFEYYEASALSFPVEFEPVSNTADALALVADLDRDQDRWAEAASARSVIAAGLAADPVLRLATDPSRYGLLWTGYSGSLLWELVDHLTTSEPNGGQVTDAVRNLTANAERPAARVASLALRIAAGELSSLTLNPSFETGGTVPEHWSPGGTVRFQRVLDGARTGTAALRLGPTPGADVRQRFAVTPGLLATRVWYRTSASGPGFLTLTLALHDQGGTRIGLLFQRLRALAPTAGSWDHLSLLEDIPAVYKGKPVAQVELVLGVAAFSDPTSSLWIDDFETYQEPAGTSGTTVVNPGFEQVSGTMPVGWTRVTGTVSSSTEVVHSGERSVLLEDPTTTGAAGLRSSHVPVTAGATCTAEVAVYNAAGEASSTLYLEFWNASGTRVATKTVGTRERDAWVTITCTATAPAETATATILVYRDQAGTGSAYFDDAVLTVSS